MTYKVWFQSMNLRYYVEMLIFLLILIYFQINIDAFNWDLGILKCDYKNILHLKETTIVQEVLRFLGGTTGQIIDVEQLIKDDHLQICREGQLEEF